MVKTEKLHGRIKTALKFFTAAQLENAVPIYGCRFGKSVVIMGGTLHGCELAEFLAKREPPGGDAQTDRSRSWARMGRDDLENLWPWFKMKRVPIWTEVKYHSIVKRGLKVQTPNRRLFVSKAGT